MLGAGGMGVVYRTRDLLYEQFGDPDPYIALKMLREDFDESPDASALLYSEFALTRRLFHPNVLRPYTFEVDAVHKQAFITMELMRGLTLDKLLCERPLGLPWPELKAIALPLLDAMAYAHHRGVRHGDVKPSNIMLGEEGVRLFDFGLGLAEEGPLKDLPSLNRQCLNAWTPGYAAPELLEGSPCPPAPISIAWLAYFMNWHAANIPTGVYLQTRRAIPGWSANSRHRATCPGAVGRRCVRRWPSIPNGAASMRRNCVRCGRVVRYGGRGLLALSAFKAALRSSTGNRPRFSTAA